MTTQPDLAELRRLIEGRVCEARFSDGAFHGAACGLEGCECPEHEWEAENPTPAGTYLTLRLTEDAPVRLGALWALIAPDAALNLAEALDALRAELAHMTEARDNARAEVERLAAKVERVRALHHAVGIYDECDCGDDADPATHLDVDEVGLTCNLMYRVCAECCRDDVYQTEDCANYHDHRLDEDYHCPTVHTLDEEPQP